jgi:hypothetical protein
MSSDFDYGNGVIGRREFWSHGSVLGVIYLPVLLLIGLPYHLYFLS